MDIDGIVSHVLTQSDATSLPDDFVEIDKEADVLDIPDRVITHRNAMEMLGKVSYLVVYAQPEATSVLL